MGLLDKVDNLDDEKPTKAKPKAAKAVAKAKPKAAKAVAKAKPKAAKAVAKTKEKPKRAAKASKKENREEKILPNVLTEGYELAGAMPRYIGWLINLHGTLVY